jgi:hypothetical protein
MSLYCLVVVFVCLEQMSQSDLQMSQSDLQMSQSVVECHRLMLAPLVAVLAVVAVPSLIDLV